MHRAQCPGALDLVSLGTVSIRVFASLSGIPTARNEEGGRARCYNQMKSTITGFGMDRTGKKPTSPHAKISDELWLKSLIISLFAWNITAFLMHVNSYFSQHAKKNKKICPTVEGIVGIDYDGQWSD